MTIRTGKLVSAVKPLSLQIILYNILCPVQDLCIESNKKNPKQKTTIVLGDSMVKHMQKGWDIGKAAGHRVVVKAFSGARTSDMVHYSKPSTLQQPDK